MIDEYFTVEKDYYDERWLIFNKFKIIRFPFLKDYQESRIYLDE